MQKATQAHHSGTLHEFVSYRSGVASKLHLTRLTVQTLGVLQNRHVSDIIPPLKEVGFKYNLISHDLCCSDGHEELRPEWHRGKKMGSGSRFTAV